MTRPISLTVNGRSVEAAVEPRTHLADFVRDALGLTGTHLGCEHGVCGACTVLIDGTPMRSCIAYAIACDGAEVRTIEGFDEDPLMQALRDAFTRHHALQCGYCTPGMLVTAYDIIRRLPAADEARVREELSGNLCRCTGYVGIIEAVRSVLDEAPVVDRVVQREAVFPPTVIAHTSTDSAPHDSLPVRRASSATPNDPEPRQSTRTTPFASSRVSPSPGVPPPAAPERRALAAPAGSGSEHKIALPISPDSLWPTLRDVATVVRCLPGASLCGPPNANSLTFQMTIAIGPIRARFESVARVTFDDRQRNGVIEGKGYDPRTRSSSEGRIEFSVEPSQTGGSVLTVALQYMLKGPLAQFSRGAVVDAVVEQLLERFAANLASAAEGKETNSSQPLGGLGLAVAAFRGRLRRWLTSSRG